MGIKKDFLNSKAGMVGVGLLVVGGLAYLASKKAATVAQEAAETVGEAVNPLSTENFLYRGISAFVDILDDGMDNDSNTLGTVFVQDPAGYNSYDQDALRAEGTS